MATILEQAVSADAAQVGTAIAALDTLEERKTAVQAAVAHITSLSTSIIAAAAQTGIITTETVAKAVGASDILARISISALKNPVGDNDVITPFDQAITDITTSTSTQKIAIAESAADTILKQAKSVITDNTASDAEKAAAAANTVAAVLYGANKADDLKNTLITAIIDNFAGETINLGDRRALSLVDSIPASRINKWAFTGIAETLVVVPNNNIIEITTIPPAEYHPIPNQFLAMILGETYTFKNKNNLADTPVSGIYKEDASTGIRYLDFSATGTAALNDPDTLRLGDYITLFNKTFVMSAAASASISDDIPNPDTPSIISTTATSLTVQWYNPSIYGGQSDGGYNIYYKLDTDTKYTSFLPSVSYTNLASGYTKEITGLIPAKQYTIKIATYFDYSLNQESTGATVQGTTSNSVPAAPTNIQTTSTTDSITITSFTAGADNGATITGYEYALNSQSATPVSVSTSPLIGFTITDLQPNTSYTIYLRAINSEGYGLWGSTIKLTLPEAAIAPYSTNQTTTSITLQWNNPTQGTESSGYKIYYKLDSEPNYSASPVLTTTSSSPAASTANITSLTSNTTYDFKITSYNSGGENSLYALVENISTLIDAPSNPTIISATPGQKTITVVWQAPMTGTVPTGYYIYYKISSVLIYPTPPIDAGLVTTYTITGLSSSVSYDVKIVAYNGSATSEGVESTNILTLLSAPTGPSTSGSPYAAPNLAHTAIEVNFEITIDGDSGLSVFGEKAIGPTNVIVAECPLPVNALYDDTTKKALIELWEPKDDPTNIAVQLANTPAVEQDEYDLTDGYKITLKTFAKGLQKVLCDKFDCKTAAPFNSSKYKSSSGEVISEYTTQRDFGRVALGAFAHYLFGHVDATSGITNDVEFLKNMLTLTETGADDAVIDEDDTTGPVNRYEAYSANVKSEIDTAAITTWTNTDGTAQDANLARRLVAAVVNKGFNTNGTLKISKMEDNTLSTAERKKELAYIVRQVVGQDATRLMNEDNSEGTLNIHRPLRFYEGDVIYLNIKLNAPQVSMTVEPGISAETFENSFPPQNYTLKITLGPREEL
jgi:hypothetical protein